jgi:squalene-hopene/tetraprenyl-beta-curcumene cyclase
VFAPDAIRALTAAVRFLRERQSPDGAWRSDTYGTFKGGDALTPLVLRTLLEADGSTETRACTARGVAYLAGMARPDGTIDEGRFGLSYPVYTAALSAFVLSRQAGQEHARGAWLTYLRKLQLSGALGWLPEDEEYGGWGYAHGLPCKPAPGVPRDPLALPNLSATAFALEALRAAGLPASHPPCRRGLAFICRCQNHPADGERPEPDFDDGGFFFLHGDPPRNKAGAVGTDAAGRPRYASYGSTTADGLRALLACGLPPEHERVRAARGWLERNFSAAAHAGRFPDELRAVQAAVYYYYCWSAAHALAAGSEVIATAAGPVRWAEALAGELVRRQRPDGSWVNDAVEVREDDPIVATALTAGALAACRQAGS